MAEPWRHDDALNEVDLTATDRHIRLEREAA